MPDCSDTSVPASPLPCPLPPCLHLLGTIGLDGEVYCAACGLLITVEQED